MAFTMTMYPALDGDCIVLSWGESSSLHHIIVDLGRGASYRAARDELMALGNVELFVMSHIDADHIAGAIPMVRERAAAFRPKRVWYNARPQLVSARDRRPILEPLGARQGEKLARGIVKFNWPWNAEFASEIVSTDSPEAKAPIPIAEGLSIRVLSPNDDGLVGLLPVWDSELQKARIRTFDPDEEENPLASKFETLGSLNVANLAGEDYDRDRTEPNGSSIAFVAEFDGKRVLLAADAQSEVLEETLKPLAQAEGGRYRLDLLKVSHHGSKANTSKIFPGLIDCTRFAVSTNGQRHDHPDPQTVARFLTSDKVRQKIFYFNYRQPHTDVWDSTRLKSIYKYDCVFPVTKESDPSNGRLAIKV
jgi:hypothetical protein